MPERRIDATLKDQLQVVLDGSPVGMLVIDDREHVIFANSPARQLFDGEGAVAETWTVADCIGDAADGSGSQGHGPGAEGAADSLQGAVRHALSTHHRGADALTGEARLARWSKDIWVRFRAAPLKIEDRHHAVLSVDDITAAKTAEQALRESENRYRTLFQTVKDGIILQAASGEILAWNHGAEEIFGIPAGQAIGKTSEGTQWPTIHEDGSPYPGKDHPSMRTLRTGKPCRNETMGIFRPDGELRWVLVNTNPLFHNGEQVPYAVAISFTDITALKQEKDLSQQYLDIASVMLLALNHRGEIILVNRRGCEILECGEKELIGKNWFHHFLPGDSIGRVEDMFARLMRDERPNVEYSEHAIISHTGKEKRIAWRNAVLTNNAGDILGTLSSGEDITEKVRASQNFQMLFREMLNGFALQEIICDDCGRPVDYRFLAVNPAFERLTGLSAADLIGKTVLEILPDTEPSWIERYGRVALTGEPGVFEAYSRAIGRTFHINAFRFSKKQFACIFFDMTEGRQAEMKLEKMRRQLSNAIEIAHLGHWEYDVEQDLFTFTDQFCAIFRTTAEAVGGYRMSAADYAMRFVHPEDRSFIAREGEEAIQIIDPNFKRQLEHRMIYADRTVGHISVLFFVVKDKDGKTVRTYGVNQDITDRVKAQEQLQQAQKMESIGNLAGGIAHDFNNILFPIVGMAEMLMEDLPPDSMEYDSAREIWNAGRRGSELVKQILAFSRQSEHRKMPVRIQPILKEALQLCRATIPSNIPIKQAIQADCGLIMADPIQIHQIVINLITNAYHAVEASGAEISIALAPVTLTTEGSDDTFLAPGSYAKLTIADNGVGIPSSVMDKIFEPYFTTKVRGKGTGLCLAVVYGIVKEHGGEIRVRSRAEEGTTFDIFLPMVEKSIQPAAAELDAPMPGGSERILLVDDEASILRMERRLLERLGYRVTEHNRRSQALKAFEANPFGFDLVISDMTMPEMTGDQLARAMIAIRPTLPIIVCTVSASESTRPRPKRRGSGAS